MTKGPNRLVLDSYLDTAQEGTLTGSGSDWKKKADALRVLADAMKAGAVQAELRIGEQTLTGPALRKGMEDSATSMADRSDQLRAAGDALVQVGTQIADTREARDSMKDLGEKPSPYQPPAGTPGAPLTTDEINAQAAASQTRQGERTSWQDAYDKQEARALALTGQMDSAFLGAIPPMKAIHGQDDPTEPPPNVPSGPGGPLLPGTQVPTGSGGDGGGGTRDEGRLVGHLGPRDPDPKDPDRDPDRDHEIPTPDPEDPTPTHGDPPGPQPDPTHRGPQVPTQTTNVTGTTQTGVTYNPGGATVSTPVAASPSPGMSTGAAMGAAGMAGGAGAAGMAGAGRGGSAPAAPARSGSAPVRAIGSTGRSGSASALSRSALSRSASAGSTAARPTAPGGASGTRAGAPGSAAARSGAAGGGAARGGTAGRSAAGAAGARGAGARNAAGSAAGGRGGRKGDREQTTDRDSLVYDQDWLGDDDVAPGVLD